MTATPLLDAQGLRDFLDREFPQVRAQFDVLDAGAGTCRLRLKIGFEHLRPGDTVSGPSMFALADVAAWLSVLTLIGPVAMAVTTNCSIDFMRKPANGVDLIGEGRVLKLGRTLAVTDALLFGEGSADPVARAGLTYAIPPKNMG